MSNNRIIHSEWLADGNRLIVTHIPIREPLAYLFSIYFYDSEDGEYYGRAGNGEFYESIPPEGLRMTAKTTIEQQ